MMLDREEILDLIDLIYEYNCPVSLEKISYELSFNMNKTSQIINLLEEYGLVRYNSICEIEYVLSDYNEAIAIIAHIEYLEG